MSDSMTFPFGKTPSNQLDTASRLRLARLIRVAVPLIMIGLAILLELFEEQRAEQTGFPAGHPPGVFYLEVFVLAVLVPGIVILGYSWIIRTLEQLDEARAAERALRLKLEVEARQRKKLLAMTVHTQEEERRRVARELHDSIGQHLTAFLLTATTDEETLAENPELAHAHHAAQNALESMRRLILDLRPALLDAKGLLPALRRCAMNTLSPTGIEVNVVTTGTPRAIDSNIETVLFRIAQEAITNVLRHSQAQNVSIELHFSPDSTTLMIVDDGRGFVSERIGPSGKEGLGLLSMRERAEQIGATFHLQTAPEEGTCIAVRTKEEQIS